MIERGWEGRLIVDEAGWTERMPQWRFRPQVQSTDPLKRQIDEQAATEELLLGVFARRYQQDGSLAPNTYRSPGRPPRLLRHPRAGEADARSHHAPFRSRDPIGQWMLDETADREAATVFLDAGRIAVRSPQQWDYLVGAGGRLHRPLRIAGHLAAERHVARLEGRD